MPSLLIGVVLLIAALGLISHGSRDLECGLSSCGARALVAHGM